jgi:uncharacterized protein YggE
MSSKKFFLLALLILAAMLSACNAVLPGYDGKVQPRTISVNGSSQMTLTPDIANISIGVHSEAEDAKEAMDSNNQQSQAVIVALVAAGIDKKDIQTTNFSIYPQERYSPTGESLGKYFAVDNTVNVKVRNLEGLGSLLDDAVQAGANTIFGISFDIENKDAVMEQGRKAAIENARGQAEQLAGAAGVKLGSVYSISSYSSYPVPMAYDIKGGGGGADMAASVPVTPGQMTITVDVNVVYEIR